MFRDKYDEAWVTRYKACRPSLKGTGLALDPETGYLQPCIRKGFDGQKKKLFVERLKICSTLAQIYRSIPIDQMAVFDALATDPAFRRDVNEAVKIPNRARHLNNSLKELKYVEKEAVISDLAQKASKYLK